MSNLNELIETQAFKEFVASIMYKHKSFIESAEIFGEVDVDGAKFYIGFTMRNGEYEEVLMMETEGERLSCEDDEIMYMYDCFASKYEKLITNNYDFVCIVMSCYDI